MLILTRKRGEAAGLRLQPGTVIPPEGLELTVTVVEIRGEKVRIGFDAPNDIAIHRAEIWDRIDGSHPPQQ